MTRSIIRTATIALAAAALAAPAASARPADAPVFAKTTAAATQHKQDMRWPDAIDAATRPAPGEQVNPRPDTPPTPTADRGTAWATIGIGIAGSLLAIGVIAGIAGRTRRTARARIAA